jgi:Stage II sporulation protein E (SpoIIE).
MKYFVDASFSSLNKHGEELCGDNVEIINTKDKVIIVMADGLGSGVKANILSTMTSKIAATMLSGGASLSETVDTIVHTLPVCNVRKLAYSTFTIVVINNDGECYVAEYDNPPIFFFRRNNYLIVDKKESEINGKKVLESNFKLKEGDKLVIASDGVVHAGIGGLLNLGWRWENIKDFLDREVKSSNNSKIINSRLIEKCRVLYQDYPGDDTTVVSIIIDKPKNVCIFTGPPRDKRYDSLAVTKLMCFDGRKVVCGGTTGKIVERQIHREIHVLLNTMTREIPPMGYLDGIDLVTEGVITLSRTLEKLRKYKESSKKEDIEELFSKDDGASRLTELLIKDCNNLKMIVGTAINPAHQNPNFPIDLSIKLKLIKEIGKTLEELGKNVEIEYIDC